MGVAAYNRGSAAISAQLDRERRDPAFDTMDALNALPKRADAVTPFGQVEIVHSHGRCWVTCPVTGFGYHYASLREAVKAWRILLTGYDATTDTWTAVPWPGEGR